MSASDTRPAKIIKPSARLDSRCTPKPSVDEAELEVQRAARKAEKRSKRDARNERRRLDRELEQQAQSAPPSSLPLATESDGAKPAATSNGSISAFDLRALLAVKNSTKRTVLSQPTPASAPVISASAAASALALPVAKGQRKKDPRERAAERAARKRARTQATNGIDGMVEDTEFATAESAPEPAPTKHQLSQYAGEPMEVEKAVDESMPTEQGNSTESESASAASSSAAALAPRPTWMTGGRYIDSTNNTPLADVDYLHPSLVAALKKQSIDALFPIQHTVIPAIIQSHYAGNDVCVAAPTGTGKTLVYLLPVLHLLAQRTVRRLRALILLPSRDLAVQVKNDFDKFAPSQGLSVGLMIGKQSFKREQQMLVRKQRTFNENLFGDEADDDLDQITLATDEIELEDDAGAGGKSEFDEDNPIVYDSLIDILVCTPGRLSDHLRATPGFTLHHLEFLVIDEVDRLISEHFDDWNSAIQRAIDDGSSDSQSFLDYDPTPHCQKLLFSATLTSDPQKLHSLQLFDPLLFTQSQSKIKKFSLPNSLTTQFVLCEINEKPLVLLEILRKIVGINKVRAAKSQRVKQESQNQIIIFCSSLENSHRLFRLFELIGGFAVGEYSSLLPSSHRSQTLAQFRSGALPVLICSDAMSRGLDISGVSHVINYDLPLSLETYIHRCGRTARAGAAGLAINIIARNEYGWFLSTVKRAANSYMNRITVTNDPDSSEGDKWPAKSVKQFSEALAKLRIVLRNERRGLQPIHEPVKMKLVQTDDSGDNDEDESEAADEDTTAINDWSSAASAVTTKKAKADKPSESKANGTSVE